MLAQDKQLIALLGDQIEPGFKDRLENPKAYTD